VTSCRDALNGYQKGKCFYCSSDISVEVEHENLCDVDHFFPHTLGRFLSANQVNLDGVWNLVLSCWRCNRGEKGKSARVPAIRYLEKLHCRNEYLIGSHHPLRETLMTQTGRTEAERRGFLQEMESFAMQHLVSRWDRQMSVDQSSKGPHKQTLSYYEANAERFFYNTRDVDMDSIYEPFLSLLPPGAHILDAGCGSGRDSRAFLERGHEVTALDASEAMVKLASQHIGRPVLHMSFDQVRFREHFDGIWACASLLHVPKLSLPKVLERLSKALKAGGVMYASFKYGEEEVVRNGRLFSDYSEDSFPRLLETRPEMKLFRLWRTTDLRPECSDTVWLNVLLRKLEG
jgi:2-polyprenyl-3-methyl-5-hydroxy-6-metoxy-1,4-benzoquinol methylase